MKKYLYMAVAAIAALSSCTSDDDPIIDEPGKPVLTFTATMEADATRATYNTENKCAAWEVGDQISVNGKTYVAQTAGLTTTFNVADEGQSATGPTYNAYFACSYDGTTATLPAAVSETWANGKFNMPMYATSDDTNLEFKNLCGVLKITVKSDQIDAVKSIKVSSANKAVSGAFTVTNNAAVLSDAENVANTLTVTYTAAVPTTAEGVVFYVAVPAQTYQQLKIQLSADGTNFTKSMTTKSATDITVARNKIYPITFADKAAPATTGTAKATIEGRGEVDVNWVQLWAGGPKFAEYNVGATSVTEYGGYYCWGSSIDKGPKDAYKGGSDPLEGDDDTAYNLWGENWRMPRQDELKALLANCDVEWTDNYKETGVKGKVFTGKGDYASNSVFLPATGSCYNGWVSDRGNNAHYWSSTPDDYCANFLYFRSDSQYMHYDSRFNGYSVRAVLAEEVTTTGTAKRTGNIDVNWVQLWENGPKFAEYNVGAANNKAEDYGGYYCWGGSIDKNSSTYKSGTDPLTGTDDTATNLWGSNWRMPTQAELEALLANCDVEWISVNGVNGHKFTGKGDYASNSVFLPAAGACYYGDVSSQGNYGRYWPSTPDGSTYAYCLSFSSGSQYVSSTYRYYGYSVRAVLAEE